MFAKFVSSLTFGLLQNVKRILNKKELVELERWKSIEVLSIIKIWLAKTGVCSLKASNAPVDLTLYQPSISDFLVKSGFVISVLCCIWH